MKLTKKENLDMLVKDCEDVGCQDASNSLGIQKMPEGYALILNPDGTHFFWLKHDGVESCIGWDKWMAYRGAVKDAKRNPD